MQAGAAVEQAAPQKVLVKEAQDRSGREPVTELLQGAATLQRYGINQIAPSEVSANRRMPQRLGPGITTVPLEPFGITAR